MTVRGRCFLNLVRFLLAALLSINVFQAKEGTHSFSLHRAWSLTGLGSTSVSRLATNNVSPPQTVTFGADSGKDRIRVTAMSQESGHIAEAPVTSQTDDRSSRLAPEPMSRASEAEGRKSAISFGNIKDNSGRQKIAVVPGTYLVRIAGTEGLFWRDASGGAKWVTCNKDVKTMMDDLSDMIEVRDRSDLSSIRRLMTYRTTDYHMKTVRSAKT